METRLRLHRGKSKTAYGELKVFDNESVKSKPL